MDKALKKYLSELVARGWTYVGQNKHIKIRSPQGRRLTLSVSPSCPHALKHVVKDVQRIERMENNVSFIL